MMGRAGLRGLLGAGLILALLIGRPARAEEKPHWQAAEDIKQALFEAQAALIAGDRAAAAGAAELAREMYGESLQEPLRSVPPAAETIDQALDAAVAAAEMGDGPALALARGQIWGGLLAGAYELTLTLVLSDEASDAQEWLLLREFRSATRFSRPDADATLALGALREGAITPAEAARHIRADLLDTYQTRMSDVLHAAEDADRDGLALRRAESVGLAQGYWLALAGSYEAQYGPVQRAGVEESFEALQTASLTGQGFGTALGRVRGALEDFRAAPLTEEEQIRRAGQMMLFLSLIPVEYERGVQNGRVFLDIEVQEAATFYEGARAAFGDVEPALSAIDADQTAEVAAGMDALGTALDAARRREQVADPQAIKEQTQAITEPLQEVIPAEWLQNASDSDFDVVASVLDQVEAAVRAGQYEQAESARLQAYGIYDAGIELRLQAFSPEQVARLEGLFWHGTANQHGLAEAIARQASPEEVRAIRVEVDSALVQASRILGEGSSAPLAVVGNAAVIVFREGLEAVIILAALVASMVGANRKYRRPVTIGALLALGVTVITWFAAQGLLRLFGRFGEQLEAVVSLIAIGMLLLITNWFFHKVYWKDWMARFQTIKVRSMRAEFGQMAGLIALGFTSIYREGFETVLFLQALVLEAGAVVVLQGVLLGLLAVGIVGVLTFALEQRLPYRRMLIITGVLIGGVLLTMVGHTVHVMQAVGWLPISPIRIVSIPYWMGVWLGIYPTWQGIVGQTGAACFVIGSYYLAEFLRARERSRAGGQAELAEAGM